MSRNTLDITDVHIETADFSSIRDCNAIIALVNEYRNDPMGGNLPWLNPLEEHQLIKGLADHPAALIFLAVLGEHVVGMTVNFIGFSTFRAQKLLNIHDFIVKKEYRGLGIGRLLLKETAKYALNLDCCRLTLEVRCDNQTAKRLYRSVGFGPCDNPMEFWINPLQ